MAEKVPTPSAEPAEEPQGMDAEARLLTSLQEIPNISKCWLRPAQAGGLSLTVSPDSTLVFCCTCMLARSTLGSGPDCLNFLLR